MVQEHPQTLECLSKNQLSSVTNHLTYLSFLCSSTASIKLDKEHIEEPPSTFMQLQNFHTQI